MTFGGIPATGAIARTATNVENGGRTPIAGITHSLVLLLIMLLFIDSAKLIPMSCLAGILIVVAYKMSEWKSFISILKGSPFDYIVLSALLFMKRMADVNGHELVVSDDIDDIENYENLPQGISVYEIGGPLFFASAKQYAELIKERGISSKILIIRMRHVSFIDSTALHNFQQTIKLLKDNGTVVLTSGTNDNVFKDLQKDNIVSLIGEKYMHRTFARAVAQAKELHKRYDEE